MKVSCMPRIVAFSAALLACALSQTAHADAINGAIYTSNIDASIVNANHYEKKTDVYLNGGPSNATCKGGDLDDGDYVFQVTDPSGKFLLSTDSAFDRTIVVSGGKVVSVGEFGTHAAVGPNPPCQSRSVQLAPFSNTPNNGTVYKVWITRVKDFIDACAQTPDADCGLKGFVPGHTKTDNFKVKEDDQEQQEELGSVRAFKFYDADADGVYDNDGSEPLLNGWKMTLESLEQAVDSTRYTVTGSVVWDDLFPGIDYTVEEGVPAETNWVHSATIYVGHDGSPVNPAGPLTVDPGQTTSVLFGNYCTVASNGRTLGFWSNKNGQALVDSGDLAELVALNLRNANGSPFDPASKTALRTWLLSGTATNMAYMLSVQMAAMKLNVLNGFVDGDGYYILAGKTVNEIIALANTSLATFGNTTSPHAQRAYQENLKDYLDALNNGDALVPSVPCAFSFP